MRVPTVCALVLIFFAILLHNSSGQKYVPSFLKTKYGIVDTMGGGTLVKVHNVKTSKTMDVGQIPDDGSFSFEGAIPFEGNFGAEHSYGGGGSLWPPGHGGSYGGGSYKVKTKDRVKTKTSGGCTGMPPSPMNAGMRCSSYGGCRADCIPNYQFPNGKTQITIVCSEGKWKVAEDGWDTVPSCEPICLPECRNNGICIAPNQCSCPENFSGPQCQFENKPCLNPDPLPKNSKRSCNSKQCNIQCLPGHKFPDGSTITTTVCDNGIWVPSKYQWVSVPDCKATCNPPCINGGSCLSFNVCQCPQEFRGPQCQYSAEVCSAKNLQFNGGYNCSGDMEVFMCSLSCPEGIRFEFPPEPKYTCLYSTGVFMPMPIPQCVYPQSYDVITHGSSSNEIHSVENGSGKHTIGGGGGKQGQFEDDSEDEFEYIQIHRHKPGHKKGVVTPEPFFNESDVEIVPTNVYGKLESQTIELLPKPGSCFTWAGNHYKTFDGKVYSFNSKCAHILLKDAIENTFTVVVQNHPDCFESLSSKNCYKIVKVYIQDKLYVLKKSAKGVPIFASANKTLPIPGQLPGIRVTMVASDVVLSLDSLGVVLKWDGQQLLHVEVQESMWNRTEGLCGKMDGYAKNDLLIKDGHSAKSILTFASSWQVEELDNPCQDSPTEENECNSNSLNGLTSTEAEKLCAKVLSDPRFLACSKLVDITSFMESCKWDYCNCKSKDLSNCACKTLEVYVRDCTHKGVKDLAQWRDENTCPMKCTDGKMYMPCGPKKGQQMCGSASVLPTVTEPCVEGCYCPEGTVLHENKCITMDQCPCKLRGKSFKPLASIPKDCNTCTCTNGTWVCTQVSCGARCAAVGDPHYVTFDGKAYDFMGQCSYYLVKSENFSIEAENVACAGSISQAMNFPASISSGLPSCTKTVTIRINGQVIKLKQNHDVVVNGIDVTKIPFNIAGVTIRGVSSLFLQVELPNGIEIWWDGVTRAYVDLPASFKEKTRGLCGTFNNNQKDDFLSPEDDVEQAVIPFANKWKTNEKCDDVPEVLLSHPCDINMHNKATAEKYCSKLKSDLFKSCHWYVDPEQFYQDCMFDMCACEFKVSKCLCPTISAYAVECSRKGIMIDWRNEVRECGVHCPGGQKYQVCGNSCTRTCTDISLRPDCRRQCVEGCNCPEGEALDDNGECIPIGQCKCQHGGLDFQPGYKEVRPASKGPELCTCLNGIWNCRLATSQEMSDYPKASDLKAKCDASRNFEFTTCEDVEPVTCKNMHSNEFFSPKVCHSGCKCKEGYVLDSKNKRCVKPTECPCHHGGKSYKEKSIVQSDCNTCKCKNGKWECTDRQCTAECSAWGDSHYKTFDGKHYNYQGQCDYVLAKGNLGTDAFDISIQNVPCGTLGTSCSKSVTIRVTSGEDTEVVSLTRDKPIPNLLTTKHLTVREKGLLVIVEAPDLGLVVQWDKGTRVYVKVSPRWKEKIKGLCGNYNDNEADDFQTPSGGLAEASAQIFGDSWRLQSYCPEAVEILDTCEDRPERKVWALKKCGVLKSALFAPCHSEVPLDSYFEKCVFDACACDQGGDCECLCTALAAYAQECNNRGVPIRWRSQQLCPMQCDERCSKYSPCISTCPHETCDNLLINNKFTKSCGEDTCIEGCNPKPCPPDYVYLNESYIDCVPRNTCKPVCLELEGFTYYEGDLIDEDACHSCYCSRGEKICKGQPCSTTSTPQPTGLAGFQTGDVVSCIEGWSQWINQDKPITTKKDVKRKIKLNEVEPLPTPEVFKKLSGTGGKCNLEQMKNIECLTVDGKHPKELGLDVECSLERGLVCKSTNKNMPCPDFKIRVLCECGVPFTAIPEYTKAPCDVTRPNEEHPTDCHKFYQCSPTMNGLELVEKTCGPDMLYNPETMICDWDYSVLKIKPFCGVLELTESPVIPLTQQPPDGKLGPISPKCPPGQISEECAIECDRLCDHYLFIVREKGKCREGTKCEAGCVSALKEKECPLGHYWQNEKSCVSKHDCLCVSENDEPVKPGKIVREGVCKECQCIDNFYTCFNNCKEAIIVEETTVILTTTRQPESTTPAFLIPSVSPPPECTEDRFINLIQGDQPLPNSAFSASSVLSAPFAPFNAKLNAKATGNSGGNWAPQYTNQDQYLEIDLNRQEPVYGVIIQGSPLYDEYVTSYMVSYTPDNLHYYYVLNGETPPRPQIFRGSMDATTPIKQIFNTPFEATKVRIKPQTWHNGISLRVEIIGCSEPTTVVTEMDIVKYCDDEMGLRNEVLSTQQITVSSELSPQHGKKYVRLNSDSSWQPLSDSPTEWVQIDFLEPRDLTGVVTKGGNKGWVTSYLVKYSQNGKDWNPIMDEDNHKEKKFLGNFDNNTPQVNNFKLPVNGRYLKIIPLKWHDTIQLRLEIHGCFKPYPKLELPSTTTEPVLPCNYCPGVGASSLEVEACRCAAELWFDGTKCVNRTMCPCMVGHIPYDVGAVFEKEDCSECICKLGGISHCSLKECPPCKKGLKATVTSTCKCICQPCPEGTILCPTSNICINSTLWCNGIRDCPDDEVNCPTTPPYVPKPVTTTVKPKTCPVVDCQPGYEKVMEEVKKNEVYKSYVSPFISGERYTKKQYKSNYGQIRSSLNPGIKTGIKTGHNRKFGLSNPQPPKEVEEELICPQYKCVMNKPPPDYVHKIEECPAIKCQPNFIPVLENFNDNTKTCPKFSCYPQPIPDAVCNITGTTFNTFDGSEFKYDICDHVIARNFKLGEWQVSLRKNCTKVCTKNLIITHENHEIILKPDLSIEYDGYEYLVDQVKNIEGKNKAFTITHLGNTLLFVSKRYGFWIIWNTLNDVKFGVVQKLENQVDGLCGFFDNNPQNDKRKPDGTLARTTADFGDSWTETSDKALQCEPHSCPLHIKDKAWEMCNRVKQQPLGQCAKVLDIEIFVSRCLETACSCLESAQGNRKEEEVCRCNAMQTFVVDCLSTDSSIDLSDWRMQHDCPAICEPPLVYHDCYQRKCEPTCESIVDPNACPKLNTMCFPGCYCPPGHVRKDDTCIKPSSCRDCECNVLPHLQYVTYDENNFTVSGNCVYVMSRDALIGMEETHKWQVLVTNHPCQNKPKKMCVGKVTILYQGHKIHILTDLYRNKLKLIVDNERVTDFEEIADWVNVRETAAKHFKILLPEEQVEISVYYPSLGVSVKASSHKYGGKLEGLCGNCNKNPNDDIRYPDGGIPKDTNDFALSWLYENLPGGQSREQCDNQPEEKCPEIPPEEDPCLVLIDTNKFGQCLNVLDPSLFLDWCKKDTCGNHPELSCAAIEAFARDCASSGFCVDWRNNYCPAENCPAGQHFRTCEKYTQETCEDLSEKAIKGKTKLNPKRVSIMEGCYCPEGKVLLNTTCVIPRDCEVCDEEGHHPGDVWKKDKCTTCKCEGTSLKCDTQYCPGKETICEKGFNAVKVAAKEDECCDKYACVPEPVGPTCETPQKLVCGKDQLLKLDTKPNGCQIFICECKPKEECEDINIDEVQLDPGYVKEIDVNGCCPVVKLTCKKEKCPEPQDCPLYYTLKIEEVEEKCCPIFSCEAPKNKCIFETEYAAAKEGGERQLAKFEKQKLLKSANDSWEDGPCRTCKCLKTMDLYQPVCSHLDCPTLEHQEDFTEFELKEVPIPNKCCPKIERVACKDQGKVYPVGETWQKDGDYCVTYECLQTDIVQKQVNVRVCNTECTLGFKYEDPIPGWIGCCGSCKQVACLVDDAVYNVGEKWTSPDHCINYICVNLNGSLQVEATKVNCPVVSKEDLNDFVFEFYPVEGECCKKHKAVACKVGNKIYKVGEVWPSTDGDKCKTVTCTEKANKNELIKLQSVQTCNKNCSKGWEYKESDTQCCGECVQTACILENNEIKNPGETWKSEDGCTEYSCEILGGQVVVSSHQEACPSVDDCPPESVYTKGCCQYCNLTTPAMKLCALQTIQLEKTVGMIEITRFPNGKCVNKHPIRNFAECIGTCHSSTLFNIKTGVHESVCSCCQATRYKPMHIQLLCEDGSKWEKQIAVPSDCECVHCGNGGLSP